MSKKEIRAFIAAFPMRRVWIDAAAQREEEKYDVGVLFDTLIEDDDEEVMARIDQEVVRPMLDEIEAYLGGKDLNSYLDDTGDTYLFEAYGSDFCLNLDYFNASGHQSFGRDSTTTRVTVRIEPDAKWDEDNEDSPLVMEHVYGDGYRFPNVEAAA